MRNFDDGTVTDQADLHLKPGDLVQDRIRNQLFDKLEAREQAVLAKLAPLRERDQRVAQLIGQGWLPDKTNAGSKS